MGGFSFSHESESETFFKCSLKAIRASDTDSPGKTPSLPSATTDSGTVECHSPPFIVPILIGATRSGDS